MLTSNSLSVKSNRVPVMSGDFTMIAKGQRHRVALEVWGEGQITTLRVICQQTGKEWWFDTFNGKLSRGFSPDGKLPNCELPAIKFKPFKKALVISPTMGLVDCGGRYYEIPSNEPTDDDFIYDDNEPSDLSRYSEPMTDPTTWQEF
jgi:hypothetical protein